MTPIGQVKAIQTILLNGGYYHGDIDGSFGAISRTALSDLIVAAKGVASTPEASPLSFPAPDVALDQAPVDARSEGNIETLHPKVRPLARALVNRAKTIGIKIVVTSGTRTYAEQDALFRQAHDGRDNDGDGRVDESDEKVTKAPAGFSNHNFMLAFDFTIFDGSEPVWESSNYAVVGKIGRELGLSWGGNWSPPDEPHMELRPPWAEKLSEQAMIAELRRRHDSDTDPFA